MTRSNDDAPKKATCRNRTGDLRFTKPHKQSDPNIGDRSQAITKERLTGDSAESTPPDVRQKHPEQTVFRVSSIPDTRGFVEWLPIPSQPGHEASSDGQIRITKTLKVRKLNADQGGYLRCSFWGERYLTTVRTHTLIAEVFIGPRPDGMVLDHLDGDKTNNHANNLEYVTTGENNRRAVAMGLREYGSISGENHYRARLTADNVREIVGRLSSETNTQIATDYGVNQATVWMIRKGRSWSHVTGIARA